MDILFRTDEYVFSYRVAGICIQNGKVLLQKPDNDTAFAFPGGHVTLGETNAQTLIREFKEEIGVDISVVQPVVTKLSQTVSTNEWAREICSDKIRKLQLLRSRT